MQRTLVALGFAAGIELAGSQSAGAVPMTATAMKDAAAAASTLQQAQYAERRARRGVVKCYRALVVGPYRCHRYPL